MATFTFYGAARIIQVEDIGDHDFTAQEVYSRWKDWVQIGDNSKFEVAFRSVAGDPISASQAISPYVFLNTPAGWRIRAHDGDHEMHVTGNLYSEDPLLSMFVSPLDGATVTITIDRSSASITTIVSGSGLDEQTVRDAMTAQGYTTARSPKLDQLDAAVSSRAIAGEGLTSGQTTMLIELYRLMGLDPTTPLIVSPTSRGAGSEIQQGISQQGATVTVTRS